MSDYVELGTVQSGGNSRYYYKVWWDEYSKKLYCDKQYVGEAYNAREAMQKAEAWAVQN